jgi:hypothetical protein
MPIEIDGIDFSGFPGRDFQKLGGLKFEGRVVWVEYRFRAFFLDTFDRLVSLEDESYIWLCVVSLLTSAVEALAHFEFNDRSGQIRFAQFVRRYFDPAFSAPMRLDEPHNAEGRAAPTSADQFYKYFRSGLAHSFCIEWGGLLHKEDGAPAYLFETPQGHHGERALAIAPRELVNDFRQAAKRYFAAVRVRQPHEPEYIQFNHRFDEVYHNKMAPPLP